MGERPNVLALYDTAMLRDALAGKAIVDTEASPDDVFDAVLAKTEQQVSAFKDFATIRCFNSTAEVEPTRASAALLGPPPPGFAQVLRNPEIDSNYISQVLAALTFLGGDGTAQKKRLAVLRNAVKAHEVILWVKEGSNLRHLSTSETADRTIVSGQYERTQISLKSCAPTIFGPASPPGIGKMMFALPMMRGDGAILGALAMSFAHPVRLDNPTRRSLHAFAGRLAHEVAWMMANRRLQEELRNLQVNALRDQHLGVWKRDAFMDAAARAVSAASRKKDPLSLLLLDLGGLRELNDEFGHDVGDEYMAHFSRVVCGNLRSHDIIGRIAGDLLGVVLPMTNEQGAKLVVEKLGAVLADRPFIHDEHEVPVEVRAVIAVKEDGEVSIDQALGRGLKELKRLKVSGTTHLDHHDDASIVGEGATLSGMYRVRHELSRGAMGVVYRCEDLGLGRQVAIKVLRSDLAKDDSLVSQFREEAGILASLHHKNLVQIYSFVEQQGIVFFVMELVEGKSLNDVLWRLHKNDDFLDLAAVSQIVQEIADALDSMHNAGLVHRDVKPANILLDHIHDRAVLVDVGVAKQMNVGGDAAGTPGFAAPESFTADAESPETDVYGLAATTYMMLTNRPPFMGDNLAELVSRQLHEKVVPPSRYRPDLPPGVDKVLIKSLAGDRSQRFHTIGAFAIALARVLARDPKPIRSIPIPQAKPKRSQTIILDQDGPAAPMSTHSPVIAVDTVMGDNIDASVPKQNGKSATDEFAQFDAFQPASVSKDELLEFEELASQHVEDDLLDGEQDTDPGQGAEDSTAAVNEELNSEVRSSMQAPPDNPEDVALSAGKDSDEPPLAHSSSSHQDIDLFSDHGSVPKPSDDGRADTEEASMLDIHEALGDQSAPVAANAEPARPVGTADTEDNDALRNTQDNPAVATANGAAPEVDHTSEFTAQQLSSMLDADLDFEDTNPSKPRSRPEFEESTDAKGKTSDLDEEIIRAAIGDGEASAQVKAPSNPFAVAEPSSLHSPQVSSASQELFEHDLRYMEASSASQELFDDSIEEFKESATVVSSTPPEHQPPAAAAVRGAVFKVLRRLLIDEQGTSITARIDARDPKLGNVVKNSLDPMSWHELETFTGILSEFKDLDSKLKSISYQICQQCILPHMGADLSKCSMDTLLDSFASTWSNFFDWAHVRVGATVDQLAIVHFTCKSEPEQLCPDFFIEILQGIFLSSGRGISNVSYTRNDTLRTWTVEIGLS